MPRTLKVVLRPPTEDTTYPVTVYRVQPSWVPEPPKERSGGEIIPACSQHTYTFCRCHTTKGQGMPRTVERKVGSRSRTRGAHSVEFLFDWDELLDEDGEFYSPMIAKGLELLEGEDYRVLNPEGSVAHLKSAPEKVRELINVEIAQRLNVPTSVKVPETGAGVATSSRNWVQFRPRIEQPFESIEALNEYIAKYDEDATVAGNGQVDMADEAEETDE